MAGATTPCDPPDCSATALTPATARPTATTPSAACHAFSLLRWGWVGVLSTSSAASPSAIATAGIGTVGAGASGAGASDVGTGASEASASEADASGTGASDSCVAGSGCCASGVAAPSTDSTSAELGEPAAAGFAGGVSMRSFRSWRATTSGWWFASMAHGTVCSGSLLIKLWRRRTRLVRLLKRSHAPDVSTASGSVAPEEELGAGGRW